MIRAAVAAIAAFMLAAVPAGAQQLTPDELAMNRALGKVCDDVLGIRAGAPFRDLKQGEDWRVCVNHGVDLRKELNGRASLSRPGPILAEPSPGETIAPFSDPKLTRGSPDVPGLVMASCRMALAACPPGKPCAWEKQVRDLIARGQPCELSPAE